MSEVSLQDLRVTYTGPRGPAAVQDLTVKVPDGGFFVLLGPSGCGKSTVLNAVAGLVQPEKSSIITVGGRTLFDGNRQINIPPDRRGLGMVFQSYALWPHMTVRDNVAYPLRRQGVRAAPLRSRVDELLELVRCGHLGERHPGQLSGGQQQRIALARALAAEPKLMLFDEPLSNLDAELRRDLRNELALLHRRLGFTAIYVTHDQAEAFGLGSIIAVMRDGRIEQMGEPEATYDQPGSLYVAKFFGANTWTFAIHGRRIDTFFGAFEVSSSAEGEAVLAAYPDRLALVADANGPLRLRDAHFVGPRVEYTVVDESGAPTHVHAAPGQRRHAVGDRVGLTVAPRDLYAFDAAGNALTLERAPGSVQ